MTDKPNSEALCAYCETFIVDAEEACAEKLAEILGLRYGTSLFVAVPRPRVADAAVFDIGHLLKGDQMAYRARKFAFRGQLDLYNRSRPNLQRWLARLMLNLPIGPWQGRTNDLEGETNVEQLRIATETEAVGRVESATLGGDAQGKGGIEVFTATVLLDVVFSAKEKEASKE